MKTLAIITEIIIALSIVAVIVAVIQSKRNEKDIKRFS
jgi:hypothetical protein